MNLAYWQAYGDGGEGSGWTWIDGDAPRAAPPLNDPGGYWDTYTSGESSIQTWIPFKNPLENILDQFKENGWFQVTTVANMIRALNTRHGFGFSDEQLRNGAYVFASEHLQAFNSRYTNASNYSLIALRAIVDTMKQAGYPLRRLMDFVNAEIPQVAAGANEAAQRWINDERGEKDPLGDVMRSVIIAIASFYLGPAAWASLGDIFSGVAFTVEAAATEFMAERLAEVAAQQFAADVAAQQAAQYAAQQAAQYAADVAAQQAAQYAADVAAQQAADVAAQQVAEFAAERAAEIAEQYATDQLAREAAEYAAQQVVEAGNVVAQAVATGAITPAQAVSAVSAVATIAGTPIAAGLTTAQVISLATAGMGLATKLLTPDVTPAGFVPRGTVPAGPRSFYPDAPQSLPYALMETGVPGVLGNLTPLLQQLLIPAAILGVAYLASK